MSKQIAKQVTTNGRCPTGELKSKLVQLTGSLVICAVLQFVIKKDDSEKQKSSFKVTICI